MGHVMNMGVTANILCGGDHFAPEGTKSWQTATARQFVIVSPPCSLFQSRDLRLKKQLRTRLKVRTTVKQLCRQVR